MEVRGTVQSWTKGRAKVAVAAGACSECRQTCPARSMARPGLLDADAPEPLIPGQAVRIEVPLPSPYGAATLAFGFPLLGLLAGLIAGDRLFGGRPLPALGLALLGAALVYGAVALYERRRQCARVTATCEM